MSGSMGFQWLGRLVLQGYGYVVLYLERKGVGVEEFKVWKCGRNGLKRKIVCNLYENMSWWRRNSCFVIWIPNRISSYHGINGNVNHLFSLIHDFQNSNGNPRLWCRKCNSWSEITFHGIIVLLKYAVRISKVLHLASHKWIIGNTRLGGVEICLCLAWLDAKARLFI